MSTDRREPADPVIGDDGLPTAPEPIFPKGFFGWCIALAVLGCVLGGGYVLLFHR